MLKNLRLGLNQAFTAAVMERWSGFSPSPATGFEIKNDHEHFLAFKPLSDLELLLSVHPNPKSAWSSFAMSVSWSRSGNFDFRPQRGTLRLPPGQSDLTAAMRPGLALEKADMSMSVLWYTACNVENQWRRTRFSTFDERYNFPWFPLRSPIHTFDPETQGPEDHKRLQAAEKAFTVADGVALAAPVVDEILEHVALHIWPFVEGELIPHARANPWPARSR